MPDTLLLSTAEPTALDKRRATLAAMVFQLRPAELGVVESLLCGLLDARNEGLVLCLEGVNESQDRAPVRGRESG